MHIPCKQCITLEHCRDRLEIQCDKLYKVITLPKVNWNQLEECFPNLRKIAIGEESVNGYRRELHFFV